MGSERLSNQTSAMVVVLIRDKALTLERIAIKFDKNKSNDQG